MNSSAAWLEFDLSVVTDRFRAKSPWGARADELELETRKLLKLCVEYPVDNISPPPLLDEYWHALILDTATYDQYCSSSFGRFLHHAPGVRGDRPRETYLSLLRNTRRRYLEYFGVDPGAVWHEGVAEATVPWQYSEPHRLHLETTNHCNLRCEHCYPASSPEVEHHDVEQILSVIENARAAGVEKITLTGGELLTRPDWKEVIEASLDACPNVYFISNGLTLTEEKLQWLARRKVLASAKASAKWPPRPRPVEIGIAISLDGLEGNALVRKTGKGKGVPYGRVLDRIKAAVGYGFHVTINTTITNPVSASEIPEMYDRIKDLGIDRWQLDQAYASGRYPESGLFDKSISWLEIAKDGYEYVVRDYLKSYPRIPDWRLEIVQVFRYDSLQYGFKPAGSLDEHPCSYQFGSLIVEGGDQLRFCPSLRDAPVGKVDSSNFSSILESSSDFVDFAGKSIRDLPCRDCRYALLFHGGCRANSLSYQNEMWARDPICCSLSPFVEDRITPLLPDHMRESFMQALTGGGRPDERDGSQLVRSPLPIAPV